MMGIEFRTDLSTIEDYCPLYITTGWNDEYPLLPEDVEAAITCSWHVVTAYNGRRLVGFRRVSRYGMMHAMIYDLMVHPGCRRRGRQRFNEGRRFAARPDDASGIQYTRP